jgi:hypothetical protein
MLAATVISVFIIPVTFVVVERLSNVWGPKPKDQPA